MAEQPPASAQSEHDWERETLYRLASDSLREQRRSRRWGIFFKSVFALYLLLLLFLALPREVQVGRHTALVDVTGVIAAEQAANADDLVPALRAAFEDKRSVGVILRANSPGGSPVQAAYLYDEIMRLREEYPDKPVYAVVTDMCASACYYIIAATDRIYANPASLVGSIGVLYDGFGFTGLMDKMGVERRLLTAGRNKGMLDPFSPMREQDKEHVRQMLDEIHQQFITAVKKGRGERLGGDEQLFTGMFWNGERAQELGLVDEFASPGTVAREVLEAEDVVDYTPKPDLLERLSNQFGVAMARIFQPQSPLR